MLTSARSFLFVPANRPERFAKALASGADAVILDLEDSVPLAGKAEARAAIRQAWPQLQQAACALVIRINSPETEWGQQDLAGLQGLPGLAGIMVPKCEGAPTLARVAQAFAGVPSLPIIESALGYLALREIAQAPQVGRLVVGHIDFLADTGMNVGEDQRELDSLRFEVAMCTRRGKLAPAVDGVTVSVDDEALIRADTERALRCGFGAKLCIQDRCPWCTPRWRPRRRRSNGRIACSPPCRPPRALRFNSTARWWTCPWCCRRSACSSACAEKTSGPAAPSHRTRSPAPKQAACVS